MSIWGRACHSFSTSFGAHTYHILKHWVLHFSNNFKTYNIFSILAFLSWFNKFGDSYVTSIFFCLKLISHLIIDHLSKNKALQWYYFPMQISVKLNGIIKISITNFMKILQKYINCFTTSFFNQFFQLFFVIVVRLHSPDHPWNDLATRRRQWQL